MITIEKEGTYKVSFEETAKGGIVGHVEGDPTPVFVHKQSLPAASGETWICSLTVNCGPNGTNYFAILQDKVETFASPEAVEDPTEESVQGPCDEYVIVQHEDFDEDEDFDGILGRGSIRSRRTVRYMGHDTLYSNLFSDGFYMVYCSVDHSRIQIIEDDFGDILCESGMIRLEGLDSMMWSPGRRPLPFKMKGRITEVSLG